MMRVILASVLLTGCVMEPADDVVADDDAAPMFTPAQADLAGEALAAGIEDAALRYGPVMPPAAADASCVTPSGDMSDPDGDTIPTSARLAFDCEKRRLGFTGVLTGNEEVTDSRPNLLWWAFSATTDLRASLTGPFGGSAVVDTDGSIVASQPALVGPFLLDSTLDVISVITNVRGRQTTVSESLDWTVAYHPDLEWNPGELVVGGSLTVGGSWVVSVDDRSADATVVTPAPLTITTECATLVTAGQVDATFAVGERTGTLTVVWSGCGAPDVNYPGGA